MRRKRRAGISDSTSDHDAAQLRLSQGVDDVGALRLHQVLQHQEAEEVHVRLHLSTADGRRSQRTLTVSDL